VLSVQLDELSPQSLQLWQRWRISRQVNLEVIAYFHRSSTLSRVVRSPRCDRRNHIRRRLVELVQVVLLSRRPLHGRSIRSNDFRFAIGTHQRLPDGVVIWRFVFERHGEQWCVPTIHAVWFFVPEDQVVEHSWVVWWRSGVGRLLESGFVEFATLVWLGTDLDNAVWRLSTFGFAVQLIAEAFNIVHAVSDDNSVAIQGTLDSRVESCPGIFLSSCSGVDIAVQSKSVVVDVLEFQTFDARFRRLLDAFLEVLDELLAAVRLARFGVAGKEEELFVIEYGLEGLVGDVGLEWVCASTHRHGLGLSLK